MRGVAGAGPGLPFDFFCTQLTRCLLVCGRLRKQIRGVNIDAPQIGRRLSNSEDSDVRSAWNVIPDTATGTHERGTDGAGKREVIRFQLCEFVCVADHGLDNE